MKAAVAKHRADYDDIFVAYADCGTGGLLEAACKELGVGMVAGPHCYSFFEGNDVFAARDEITAFYLTDFLVRQFDAFVWEPLGLGKHPGLRDMYFGNYEKLVYQSQTDDPALTAKAEDCAARLGLAFERRFTGYGDLTPALTTLAPEAAAAAVSLILSTMARSPLERCADRWSFRPRRPSSAAASMARMSATGCSL